jgi:chitinase
LTETFAKLVILKQSSPNLKIFLSVGGWTLSSQLISMSATADGRRTFIKSVVSNLRQWNLDGLDVDWEFPQVGDKSAYSSLLTVRILFGEVSS